MLLIAIPKSSSTSLMTYISRQHKIPAKQMNLKGLGLKVPEEYKYMGMLHCCCVNLTEEIMNKLVNDKVFYRQHIPPTEHNLKLIKKYLDKILILLRNPIEVLFAYHRGRKKGFHPDCESFYNEQFFYEIKKFCFIYSTHLMIPARNIIYYPLNKEDINYVEKFYGFPITKNPILPKEKYTRG